MTGRVRTSHVAPGQGTPMERCKRIEAIADRGLEGGVGTIGDDVDRE